MNNNAPCLIKLQLSSTSLRHSHSLKTFTVKRKFGIRSTFSYLLRRSTSVALARGRDGTFSRRALNAAREQPTSSCPRPVTTRHANVYSRGVFSGCSLNSPRRRSRSVEHGKGRAGGAGENNGQEKESRFCFASRKVPSGARKGNFNIFARGLGDGVGYRE